MTDGTRERIIAAALDLLTRGGEEAVSTRAVSAAAGVQPPTIYRFFGDKQGLLDAIAVHGLRGYLATKATAAQSDDPVADLRRGWDLHVELGLANPALYTLMYGRPRTDGAVSAATRAAADVLAGTSAASPRRGACASPSRWPWRSCTRPAPAPPWP
ncbi:hypothetical protein GCM10020358_83150 [Amorphoplanes nipponensis]|uniref:TetR/AcrR family transcriptional regulator n=1 Tax=Actinoplanes nipponensis TaxID=135950 RepID=UPI0031ED0733